MLDGEEKRVEAGGGKEENEERGEMAMAMAMAMVMEEQRVMLECK